MAAGAGRLHMTIRMVGGAGECAKGVVAVGGELSAVSYQPGAGGGR